MLLRKISPKLERWQGPPHIRSLDSEGIVLSFQVSLFIQFIQSKSFSEDLSLVITITSSKLHTAPLNKDNSYKPHFYC